MVLNTRPSVSLALVIHCIGTDSKRNITLIGNTTGKYNHVLEKIPKQIDLLRVSPFVNNIDVYHWVCGNIAHRWFIKSHNHEKYEMNDQIRWQVCFTRFVLLHFCGWCVWCLDYSLDHSGITIGCLCLAIQSYFCVCDGLFISHIIIRPKTFPIVIMLAIVVCPQGLRHDILPVYWHTSWESSFDIHWFCAAFVWAQRVLNVF